MLIVGEPADAARLPPHRSIVNRTRRGDRSRGSIVRYVFLRRLYAPAVESISKLNAVDAHIPIVTIVQPPLCRWDARLIRLWSIDAMSPTDPEPDQPGCTIEVGQDSAGHWLVQDNRRQLEGRFVSFASAMAFARSERHSLPGAVIVLANDPIVPIVSFAPVQPWETAPHYRAAA